MILDDRREGAHKDYDMVIAHDTLLSGWGRAANGKSYCAWSAAPEAIETVKAWVEEKPEMQEVRIVPATYTDLENCHIAHLSVWMVKDGHPALMQP